MFYGVVLYMYHQHHCIYERIGGTGEVRLKQTYSYTWLQVLGSRALVLAVSPQLTWGAFCYC